MAGVTPLFPDCSRMTTIRKYLLSDRVGLLREDLVYFFPDLLTA